MARRKSWREKVAGGHPPKVKRLEKDIAGMRRGQMMLVPSPQMVEDRIRAIPEGTALDAPGLRAELAAAAGADVTCPMTTGIFLRLIAEAAWEDHRAGLPFSALAPVWRVLDSKSPTLKKISFDPQFLIEQRRREGLPV